MKRSHHVPSSCGLAVALAVMAGTTSRSAAEQPGEGRYLANLRQVTSGMPKAGEGYFSPDGQTIVYQAVPHDYPFYQIFAQRLAGGEPRRISTGRGRTTCSYFSPDGQRILFASSHLDPHLDETEAEARRQQAEDLRTGRQRRYQWDFDPQMDIFEVDRDGENLHRLTREPGYDAEAAYSPDGRWIALCSDRDGDPDIYLMRSEGSDVRQLTHAPGYDGGPFISPDGRWIVFRSDRKQEGFLQLYVIGVDGRNERALTDNHGVNWGPSWHPRLPYLVWAGADHSQADQRPNYDLWLMRYDLRDDGPYPGPVTRLTDHPSADVLPVFSPNGQQLMWTSTRTAGGSSQLWIADFTPPEVAGQQRDE